MGGAVTPADKLALRNKLKELENELNRYLAGEYGVEPNQKPAYQKWLSSHKPLHWFIEFHGILKNGGFDVIVGNNTLGEFRIHVPGEHNVQNALGAVLLALELDIPLEKIQAGLDQYNGVQRRFDIKYTLDNGIIIVDD